MPFWPEAGASFGLRFPGHQGHQQRRAPGARLRRPHPGRAREPDHSPKRRPDQSSSNRRGRQRTHNARGGRDPLQERQVRHPDILCNAGGVTVSYFEWVQDLDRDFWSIDQVNDKLRRIMTKAFASTLEMSLKRRSTCGRRRTCSPCSVWPTPRRFEASTRRIAPGKVPAARRTPRVGAASSPDRPAGPRQRRSPAACARRRLASRQSRLAPAPAFAAPLLLDRARRSALASVLHPTTDVCACCPGYPASRPGVARDRSINARPRREVPVQGGDPPSRQRPGRAGVLDNVEDLLTDVITSPGSTRKCSPWSGRSK